MRAWRRRCAILLWALLVLGLAGAGCQRAEAPAHTGAGQVNPVSAWLAEVRAAHAAADAAVTPAEREAARQRLGDLAGRAAPAEVAAIHARAVRQDLYFRVASVAAEAGDDRGALDAASAGLALGRDDDVLTANLLIARGEAHEALNDEASASADYLAAQRIHEQLLDAVLDLEDAP